MEGDILVPSGEAEKIPLCSMQSLNSRKNFVQVEHASNRTPISHTLSSSTAEMVATYIANIWRPTTNTTPQIKIVTTTPQIIATNRDPYIATTILSTRSGHRNLDPSHHSTTTTIFLDGPSSHRHGRVVSCANIYTKTAELQRACTADARYNPWNVLASNNMHADFVQPGTWPLCIRHLVLSSIYIQPFHGSQSAVHTTVHRSKPISSSSSRAI
ncbi:unnamed protein product [Lactuca saligna]|uniref:Uncharacterized protein n=1 Tax=Lactuca saligna TaxID=75948 RepID=A0AA36EPT8_LACSI|nr:unnamed protein product [Lactuca saligna]